MNSDVRVAVHVVGILNSLLLAPCTRKKTLQRKMTKNYYWISVQDNIRDLTQQGRHRRGQHLRQCDLIDCITVFQ